MNLREICTVLTIIWIHFIRAEQKRLNDYIQHYEELSYDADTLQQHHLRAKRSTNNPHIRLKFQAHSRNFHLRLRKDTSTFSKNAKLELSGGETIPLDTSHIYQGELVGEHRTLVQGSIINGIFAGTIYTPEETYHVERSDAYFKGPLSYHSIIYRDKDINPDPHRLRRDVEQGTCGSSNDEVRRWMTAIQNSAIKKDDDTLTWETEDGYEDEDVFNDYLPYNKYLHPDRRKRATASPDGSDKRSCTLFLQSDTMLWDRMTSTADNGLGYNEDRAREEITSLFGTHVVGIKQIYEKTVFKNPSAAVSYSGITFVVHRVKINETKQDCPKGPNTPLNLFCKPNIDVSNFLNINSLKNHDDFCLAYVFTYRDFTGGTLGLAWVGAPSSAAGGICERWKEYQENHNRVYKSLNTGIVTLINYNSPVPPKVSTLTFAHEVGHNFGSPHDSGSVCTPFTSGNTDGNFIMYASATSGDRPNNSKFSECSKANISMVLDAVFHERYGKKNCFEGREEAFCGNQIVEDDEVCDCGYDGDCTDNCCYGRNHQSQCQLKPKIRCSPSQGPCCNHQCNFIAENEDQECSPKSECNLIASCSGDSAQCPKPDKKPDRTPCNDFTQVCLDGECSNSICQVIEWEQCFLEAPVGDKNFDKGTLCYVSCHDPNLSEPDCVSTGNALAVAGPENGKIRELLHQFNRTSIKLPPGAPCNNFRGYCDVFQKCRDVDADGPLSRLKKLLFNDKTFNTIRAWIIKQWWAVLLMGIGLVVFMGIFIQVCAVHTPSSNPKKPPARKISLRPKHHQRQQGPPPPYVGPSRGGPPHGKGRGPAGARPPQYEMRSKHKA